MYVGIRIKKSINFAESFRIVSKVRLSILYGSIKQKLKTLKLGPCLGISFNILSVLKFTSPSTKETIASILAFSIRFFRAYNASGLISQKIYLSNISGIFKANSAEDSTILPVSLNLERPGPENKLI